MDAAIEDWSRNYELQRTRDQKRLTPRASGHYSHVCCGSGSESSPRGVVARLDSAGAADLERWSERVLDAARLADVFGDH